MTSVKVDENTRARCGQNVFARDFEGELVLLDLARGDYYGLDPLGAALWHGLIAGRTAGEIVRELSPQYDVEPERLREDMLALLGELVAKGLVEVLEGEAAAPRAS